MSELTPEEVGMTSRIWEFPYILARFELSFSTGFQRRQQSYNDISSCTCQSTLSIETQ